MRNILAIANKELRHYFASPIAYIVIGFFVLLFGWFYWNLLWYFVQQTQFSMPGQGAPLNVNQMLINLLFQNTAVVILLALPIITMRTFAEEKRAGTMELLLTSPVTDFQIIMGKFLGAMGLYAAMLAVTLVHIGVLFVYGNPEWGSIVTGYLGLLLLGGCFISVGLFISSITRSLVVAAFSTFAVFLMLWVVNWASQYAGPTVGPVLTNLSIVQHFEDFGKGVLDTQHLVYYLSFITFGLFLTSRAVDAQRWRG